MSLISKILRGTKDILPEKTEEWRRVKDILYKIFLDGGYQEIITPTIEGTGLFKRDKDDTSDIVQKEMYSFIDKGNRDISLKPEGTASVVRSVVETGLINNSLPLKLFYFTQCFRYEKPQQGRYREFYQFGAELFGSESFLAEVDIIYYIDKFFKKLELENIHLEINSIGCDECRPIYTNLLKEYIEKKDNFCVTCKTRCETNPLRSFDCKNPICKEVLNKAPSINNHICESCKNHDKDLKQALDGLNISYISNSKIVRGLDYYNKTVFEFTSREIGAQGAICGGGRYDKLVSEIGGKQTPAVGFGIGFERLIMIIEHQNKQAKLAEKVDIYIANIEKSTFETTIKIFKKLDDDGFKVLFDIMGRSLKSQFKYADKICAKKVLIIGEQEMEKGIFLLKNMETSIQEEFIINDFLEGKTII
ncbi:MAG: histidine--tRNA ligase [Oscillospiraceae bacterium]|nr:histidine--tRNA ligase [Oscillospiraceae bacterium]